MAFITTDAMSGSAENAVDDAGSAGSVVLAVLPTALVAPLPASAAPAVAPAPSALTAGAGAALAAAATEVAGACKLDCKRNTDG